MRQLILRRLSWFTAKELAPENKMVIFLRSQSETLRDKNPSNSWAFVSSEKFLEGITDSIPKHHIIFCVSGLSAGRSCQQRGMCVCPFFFQDTFLSSTRLLPMVAPDLIWNTFRTYSKTNIHRLHCLINITRQLLKVKQRFEKTGWLARGFY